MVVTAGDAVKGLLEEDPGIHKYEFAPEPVRMALLPAQMVSLLVVTLTTGRGFTTIFTVRVVVQPAAFAPVTV
jgi:hypothetical protein